MEEQTLPTQELEHDGPIGWKAAEFEYHAKKGGWYVLFGLGLAILVAVAILTKQWLSIGVFAVMGASLLVYTIRKPRELEYMLDDEGIAIDGKLHPYDNFQSFALVHTEKWLGIDLDPIKRFMPRVSVALDDETGEEVIVALSAYLPRVDREPDMIEKISRRLKF